MLIGSTKNSEDEYMMTQEKICKTCKQLKNITDFYKAKKGLYGVTGTCKVCTLEKSKTHYKTKGHLIKAEYAKNNKNKIKVQSNSPANKKKRKERNKLYRQNNKDKIKTSQVIWVSNNKEKVKEYQDKYREDNKIILKEKYKIFYDKNKETNAIRCKEYRLKNKEKVRATKIEYDKKYRQKIEVKIGKNISRRLSEMLKGKKNNIKWETIVGYSASELKQHLESKFKPEMSWGNYGLFGWHIDHIIPKSSFVVTDYYCEDFKKCWALSNLQPLWAIDNLKKGKKILTDF